MTSTTKDVWYHCGHCGSLFQSDFGFDESRVCEVCEKRPGVALWPVADTSALAEGGKRHQKFVNSGEKIDESGHRAVRKKRRSNIMLRIVIAWTLLLIGVVAVRHYFKTRTVEESSGNAFSNRMTEGTLADERVSLLQKALPDCHRALGGFLAAGTPEARNQFVLDPIETAGKMATFYARNSFPKVDVTKLRRTAQEVLRVGDEWMIATRWKEEGEEGVGFDAIFQYQSGAWKLDWLHFSRYSEFPWTLFLAGEGPDEAEFRLLARLRFQGDEAEQTGARLTFAMMAPEWGKPSETGMESPEFVVDRRGDEGLLLQAAFDHLQDDEGLFGSSLESMEPERLVRLRVKVKRDGVGGIRRFRLEELSAWHWIDTEVPGYDLDALREASFGGG